ncbi:MAG: helix-turn-helix domain-containing protein [Methanomethylovorans sp.]|jgi:transcriptional regulator with XRE-family HTH domain|uniref:helix-turn-helix domain-containing protein n=1 Tax=Methanomethylovorans sp. TaxID=2758717 RepID=UPI0009D0C07D|nr:MAG: DNA-binding transcriptional repressor PuuR [Methanomethylovorans sp. PtaU1.Bin073]
MSEKNLVGNKIRQLREAREMSVEELAEASHSSVELIQQLENGAFIPSLTPLLQIARALGVRLGTFLDDATQNSPVVVRSGKSEQIVRFSGNCPTPQRSILEFSALASNKIDRHMEPFLIDVHPLGCADINPSAHEGEEFIYVLKGQIEILYGKEQYKLNAGDSIYYDSVVPHHVHASGDSDAQILAVVYTPL